MLFGEIAGPRPRDLSIALLTQTLGLGLWMVGVRCCGTSSLEDESTPLVIRESGKEEVLQWRGEKAF